MNLAILSIVLYLSTLINLGYVFVKYIMFSSTIFNDISTSCIGYIDLDYTSIVIIYFYK